MKILVMAGGMDHIQLWPMLKKNVKNILRDMGIKFVSKNPDMILYHTYKAPKELTDRAMNSGIPIMILERIASARIYSRKHIQQDNVVGVLKSTTYRDPIINNSEFIIKEDNSDTVIKNDHHYRLIYECLNIKSEFEKPKDIIPAEYFDKVELWYNFGCYQMMIPYVQNNNLTKNHRLLDVGFIGTTRYGEHSKPATLHRQEFLKRIKKIVDKKIEIYDHRIKGKNNYINNIINCKVGVSPWGLGEKCYRDFEVIFGGGVLVKPNTSFVLDWTDTYNLNNQYYIPCNIDFSDLHELLNEITSNWEKYMDFRSSARNRLIHQCWNDEYIANHISDVFNRCTKRIKK